MVFLFIFIIFNNFILYNFYQYLLKQILNKSTKIGTSKLVLTEIYD